MRLIDNQGIVPRSNRNDFIATHETRIPYPSPLPLASPPWEETDGVAVLGDAESVSFPHGSALLSTVKR